MPTQLFALPPCRGIAAFLRRLPPGPRRGPQPRRLAAGLAALLTLIPAAGRAQFNAGTGVVRNLYLQNCATCHGVDLRGGGQGPALIGRALSHGTDDASIARTIAEGVPNTPMIAWKHALSAEQIRSLVIYMHEAAALSASTPPRRPVPEKGTYQARDIRFRLERIATGNSQVPNPDSTLWGFVFLPDQSILCTQRDGVLWHFVAGQPPQKITGTPTIWRPGDESGMFDIALHPDYAHNGWIYLSFSETREADPATAKTGMTVIVRGRIKNGRWTDQQYVFRAAPRFYTAAHHHFGCRLLFRDGYLYFSLGDRTNQDNAQDLASPLGKIHRVRDDGSVPPDNPFVPTKCACGSIWTYGHRNVQGLAIQPGTGELWVSEHGPRGGDELNLIRRGLNYGWPLATYGMNYDGSPITPYTSYEGTEPPRWQWTPSIAPSGIAFYTGNDFPAWRGSLFIGGMWSEELHRVTIRDDRVVDDEIVLKGQGRVRDVVNGPDGHLYISLTNGQPRVGGLFRLVPLPADSTAGSPPPAAASVAPHAN